ncbi:hypothetical protein RV134_350022 [Roseovarius sp. EC-HK134]|nr:hypothetical protein RV134_350022 [Roseovarius sp. EC-HK134]
MRRALCRWRSAVAANTRPTASGPKSAATHSGSHRRSRKSQASPPASTMTPPSATRPQRICSSSTRCTPMPMTNSSPPTPTPPTASAPCARWQESAPKEDLGREGEPRSLNPKTAVTIAATRPKSQCAESRCRRHRRAAPVRPLGRALLRPHAKLILRTDLAGINCQPMRLKRPPGGQAPRDSTLCPLIDDTSAKREAATAHRITIAMLNYAPRPPMRRKRSLQNLGSFLTPNLQAEGCKFRVRAHCVACFRTQTR